MNEPFLADDRRKTEKRMSTIDRFKTWLEPIVYLSNNVVSLIGVVLTTIGGVSWLFLLPIYFTEREHHPYVGILFYMIVPGIFITGLLLIPLGIWLKRIRMRRRGEPLDFPPVNWESPSFRKLVYFIAIATVLNIIITGHLTIEGVSYMDSTTFCGQACHTVMQPEYAAYQESPHFRVGCTDCHIGEGADWFVKSKLSGVRQVFAVALNTHPRPIPTPIDDLRPARETCENCHWPQMFPGNRLRIIDHFAEDEENTHTKTVLMMHIGGGHINRGIHGFHLDPGVVIQYRSDRSRMTIPWVSYRDAQGQTTIYKTADWDPAREDEYELRVMDCLDCHNRPSHTFELQRPALDQALGQRRIPADLPWIRAKGRELLETEYASHAEASSAIPESLNAFYRTEHPEVFATRAADIQRAGDAIVAIYRRNVFPEMKVTWGTYPNHIGHEDFPGCFRCHDDMHDAEDGRTINQDCVACHEIVAWDEEDPEIIRTLGIIR
jgi:hypothetical protein